MLMSSGILRLVFLFLLAWASVGTRTQYKHGSRHTARPPLALTAIGANLAHGELWPIQWAWHLSTVTQNAIGAGGVQQFVVSYPWGFFHRSVGADAVDIAGFRTQWSHMQLAAQLSVFAVTYPPVYRFYTVST